MLSRFLPILSRLALALTLLLAHRAAAQPENLDGRFVRELRILVADDSSPEFQPADERTDQIARNQLRLRAGTEYDGEIARADIARLDRLGRFRTIEHLVQELGDGSLVAVYRLRIQPVIEDVQVVGNRKLSDQQLAAAIDLLPGTPVDEQELGRAARRIRELYRERGYYNAEVSVDREELAETGIVLFRIREGGRLRVTDLRVEGNAAYDDDRIRDELETEEGGLFRRGPLDVEIVDRDVATIVRFYQDRGYLDVRADREVRRSPDGREAIVTFYISEGPLYTLRDLIVEYIGDHEPGQIPVMSREQIIGLVGMKPGDTYSASRADRVLRVISDAYGKLGHFRPSRPDLGDFRLRRRERRDPELPEVDLIIYVDEGPRVRAGEIIIAGNELTRQNVIRREIPIRPDRPLDTTKLRESEQNLLQTRLFSLQPFDRPFAGLPDPRSNRLELTVGVGERSTDPGRQGPGVSANIQAPYRTRVVPDRDGQRRTLNYRDVLVEVTETNTALLSFGATASSDDGVVGVLSYEQRNFDVFDTPDSVGEFFSGRSFRGGGQTFNITAQPGVNLARYSIGLSDPAILDTEISASGSLNLSTREFDEFREERAGANLGLGRKFGGRWVGRTNLRIQSIDLSGFETDAPADFFAAENDDLLTGVGFTLRRTTIDNRLRPTQGTVLELSVEQVGLLGGDFDFTSLNARGTIYIPVAESDVGSRTVVKLEARSAYMPQGQSAVPFYDRHYLGGTSFRGIQFRDVSPKGVTLAGAQTDTPVGGTFLLFTSAEYIQPLFTDNIAGVLFVDAGSVEEKPGLTDARLSIGTGVRLYVPQLSPAPLAFDFGYALKRGNLDGRSLFSFSVDIPF